ncbi:hypothetical protein OKA05_06140 [Luteolibacter arcticus]|uniref:DoxX family protein n=1 Tax=Luteolibacter arcticus TaxID=1581411 RepID=A0ABT3GEU2_9BACT|nr:hypothetical protein [Luteolibacter arcticus]MCW1922124.1 hypothetical protein [Luteolibacter arcticus]
MKYLPCIAGGLLGAIFLMASLMFFFKLMPDQPLPPEGSPPAHFMAAFGPTGYMTFVKAFELIGAILVIIPRTRNFGLLILGPILINILAFHIFVTNGAGIFEKPFLTPIACVAALYLLWVARKQFAGLANR